MATTTMAELKRQNAMTESSLGALLAQRDYTPKFDADAWHVMQERDNAMIRDEIMHGHTNRSFIYEFKIKGKIVRGVSVIGARELATQYKGIKHRVVATVEKRGSLFIFRSFDPINITTQILPELADEGDYYECIVEINDIKTGNSLQCRKKESRFETSSDGSIYEQRHFDVIAESKAFRNGVLSILPQNVIKDFQERCVKAGDKSDEQTIDQLRSGAIAFAAKHSVSLDRKAVHSLTYAELIGMGSAAKSGKEAFITSAESLGVIADNQEHKGNDQKRSDQIDGSTGQSARGNEPPPQGITAEEMEQARLRDIAEAEAERQQAELPRRQRNHGRTME